MKKNLTVLIVFFVSILPLIAQNDLQWLIFKGKGKRGTIDATTNNYSYSFDAATDFNLEGIKNPDTGYYPYVRNDIFIIYEDGTNYNSRLKVPSASDHGFFYGPDLSIMNHHFLPGDLSKISYLYMSNIYEQDDPPKNVRAKTGAGSGAYDSFTVPLVSPTVDPMFADHDVVQNTDITLILDNAKIKEAATASGVTLGTGSSYVLHFNSVVSIGDPSEHHEDNFFAPRPIFTSLSGAEVGFFPTGVGTYSESANTVTITVDSSPFVYVNLRPSSALSPYYPGADGEPAYNAIFSLTSTSGVSITSMNEAIRSSHDPNFIRIDSICKDAMANQIVFCHIEFENTGTVEPKSVSVSFKLPEGTDDNCFEIMDWFIGGSKHRGTYERDGAKVTCFFNMKGVEFVKCLSPTDKTSCKGYINFNYKLKSTIMAQNISTNIWVTAPNVFFGKDRYPIKRYEDLIDIQYHGQTFSGYYRPIITKHLCSIECLK